MSLLTKQKETHTLKKQTYGCQGEGTHVGAQRASSSRAIC